MTSHHRGHRAGRARPRRSPARVGTLLAAVVAIWLSVATPALAQAVDPGDPSTPPTTEAPPGTTSGGAAPHLDLVSQTPFVAPTDVLRIGLDLAAVPDGAELTFTLRSSVTAPRDNRTAQARFDEWVDGSASTAEAPFNSPKTVPVANLPPGDQPGRVDAAFEIVPEGPEPPLVGFQIADAGVYPLTIDLRAIEGGPVLDTITTFLVRLPTSGQTVPPLAVAPIAALHAPVALTPDGTRSLDPSALSRVRRLVDVLAARADVPMTVVPTPETLESLIGVPSATAGAPGSSTTLLDRLRDSLTGRSVLGSTYVRVDVPAWTSSDMGEVLAYQLSHGANVAEAVLEDQVEIEHRTWVADPGLTPEALGQLNALGIDQVVLDGSVVGPVDPRAFPDPVRAQVASTQPFDVRTADGTLLRSVATDGTFGERLRTTDDADLNAQILVADLAVTYFGAQSPQVNDVSETHRGVTFAVPDDEVALTSLDPFLEALGTTPPADGGGVAILDPATVDDLFALTPAVVDGATEVRTFTPDPAPDAPEDMGPYPEQLDSAEYDLSAYESMVVDTQPDRVLPLRQLLDVSGATDFDEDERTAYLDAVRASVATELGGVRVPEQDAVTLTTSEYELSIFVENDLTYPVAARLELSSTKLDFPDGDEVEVRLEPGNNRIPIKVKTVSGGTFPVDIELRTPDNRIALDAEVIQIRSTAVSGWGLALSIGAGFFLLVWWARNWRSTRRAPADPAAPAGDGDGATGDAHPSFTVGALDDLTKSATGTGTTIGSGADARPTAAPLAGAEPAEGADPVGRA